MRKLSLFIIAAGATLGVAVAQADDAIQAVEGPDAVTVDPQVAVDPVPEPEVTTTGEAVDPAVETPDVVMYPVDKVVELTDGQSADGSAADTATGDPGATDDTAATGDTKGTDDTAATDDTASTDGSDASTGDGTDPVKVDDVNVIMYNTSGGTDTRPEGCMECRTLTGESSGPAVEAPAPEVTADVLDGNATGVDVMDPVEANKRK